MKLKNIGIFSFKNTDFDRQSLLNNTWKLLSSGVQGSLDSYEFSNHSKFNS